MLTGPLQPPPPQWLTIGLATLQQTYPNDSFEAFMKYTGVNIDTNAPIPPEKVPIPAPANISFFFLPRIRCHDCPGKLYTPGPGETTDNFEIHLKNRQHREKVEKRVREQGGAANGNASNAQANGADGGVGHRGSGSSQGGGSD
jgi:SWI/SNF-related matrix-associated actin-dependent regulator of chromatin subfamily B member 1